MKKIKGLIVFLLLGFVSYSQSLVEKSRYEQATKLITNSGVQVKWNGQFAYYLWSDYDDKILYRVDLHNSKKQVIVSESKLKKSLNDIGSINEKDLSTWSFGYFDVDAKNQMIQFRVGKERLKYVFKTGVVEIVEGTNQNKSTVSNRSNEPFWKKFNADSTKYIYGRGHQLYLFDRILNKEFKLSNDGEPYFSYNNNNTSEYLDTTKYVSTQATWIGEQIITWREDKRHIAEMHIINSLSEPIPTLKSYKFPMPGDSKTIAYDVCIWNSNTKKPKKVEIVVEENQRLVLPGQLINGRTVLYADRLGSNSSYVYFLRRGRSNEKVELCKLDLHSADVTVLISEVTSPHINEQLFAVHQLVNGDFLFWSERTGFGHFYRYDAQGKLLNKIGPKGQYVVSKIVEVLDNNLVLEVYGYQKDRNPYHKQYILCPINISNGVLLTPEVGSHQITMSEDKKYFLDTYSSANTPNSYKIRNLKGTIVADIGVSDHSKLKSSGWKEPEMIKVLAADDSTVLYGLLYKPFDFDANKKYPVIASVYPGPQDDFVPQMFSVDDNYHQTFADLGFIVMQLPSRGSSPYRGLQFHGFSYGNMRDYPLEDNKKAILDLAESREYMDLTKVGIYGHSGGGFMTATAMMMYPEFYKVGVAASGNYDPNIYTQWWGESYHGLNTKGVKKYIPSTLQLAHQLQGKLLLITGDMDTNVHPANTFRLADALIKSNKFFDMMVLPGKDHGLGDWYYQSLIMNYFSAHLK